MKLKDLIIDRFAETQLYKEMDKHTQEHLIGALKYAVCVPQMDTLEYSSGTINNDQSLEAQSG